MKLEELHLDGFGRFHRQAIGPLHAPVTVIYGPNEAGKSTLLAFVRAVLFGFPQRKRNEHYPPLAGGRHGGRIRLTSDAGESFTLERYNGPKGGDFVLRNEAGREFRAPGSLEQLTGRAPADLFQNVFAFGIDELQDTGLLDSPDVADRIYGAGMGAARLPLFSQSLARRKDELYKPRGSAQRIAQLLRELKDLDQRIRQVQTNADRYGQLLRRRDGIKRELDRSDLERGDLSRRHAEALRMQDGWEDWEILEECGIRLGDMPEFEQLPENAIERLENLEQRMQQAREDRDDAGEQNRKTRAAATVVIPGEALLPDQDRIEDIRRDRSYYDNAVRDLPERRQELRDMEQSLEEKLRQLGPDWNEANLDRIDTSLAVRSEVERWQKRILETTHEASEADTRLTQDSEQWEALKVEEANARRHLRVDEDTGSAPLHPPSGSLEALLADREPIEAIRRRHQGYGDSVADLPERQAELNALESDLRDKLRDLGSGWDESRLENFDISMVFRQEVERWRENLNEHRERTRQVRQQLEAEKSALEERSDAVRAAEAGMAGSEPDLDAPTLDRLRATLRRARSRLGEFERARHNQENLQGQVDALDSRQMAEMSVAKGPSPIWFAVPLLVIGAGLLLYGFFGPEGALGPGLAAGGLCIFLAAGYLLFGRGPAARSEAPPQLAALRQALEAATVATGEAWSRLVAETQPLDLDASPSTDALDEVEARLDAATQALATWIGHKAQLDQARDAWSRQQQRHANVVEQHQAVTASAHDGRREWREWLEQRAMDSGLTPETVTEFTGRIETARAILNQVQDRRHRVRAIQDDIEEYQALIRPVADRYGVVLDDSSHPRVMAVANLFVQQLDHARELVKARNDASRRRGQQEQKLAAGRQQCESIRRNLVEVQTQWQDWLLAHHMPEGLSPAATLEFLAQAETARASRNEVERMRARVQAIENDITEFHDQLAPLAAAHGIPLEGHNRGRLGAPADNLIQRFDQVRSQVAERDQAHRQNELDLEQLQQRERRLRHLEREHRDLLQAGDTADAEEFRRRVRQQKERLAWEGRRDECLRSLRRLSGPDRCLDDFRAALAATDRSRLRQETLDLEEKQTGLEERRNAWREELGGIDNELEQLAGEEESSRLRIQRNILMEQLQDCAAEWSKLTLAEVLLDRTRKKFERERQPNVINHAKTFFSGITGHRYSGLFAPVGQRTITVTDASGQAKLPAALSRGTREQLYLALRFGLILEFGEHAERLPVVVDEALINFDPERARYAAEAFARLAETHQVLVFTCHHFIVDLFESVGASTLDIGAAGSSP